MLINKDRDKLEELRTRLAENSESLIRLFRERSALAREIGGIKRNLGLPSRIRDREEAVMEGLSGMDQFSRSIISALFEYSIVNETSSHGQDKDSSLSDNEITISGPTRHLEFLAGLLVSRPGVEVYTNHRLPFSMENGLQINGAHIIEGSHNDPDITICLQKGGGECDIFISSDNEMHMKLMFPISPNASVVRIHQ